MDNKYYSENSEFFCEMTAYKNALFTNSASAAFHSFILSNEYKSGDEIIFPVECYPTFPMIAIQCGLKPVFVDVDDHYNLSAEKLENSITEKTRFVVVIHMSGIPAEMDKIEKVLTKYKDRIILIEDLCQVVGTLLKKGIKKSSLTKGAVISFSSSKLIGIDGGGVLLTDAEDCFNKAKIIINNGYDPKKRFIMLGYSYAMHIEQEKRLLNCIKNIDQIINESRERFENTYYNLSKIFKPIYKDKDDVMQHKIVTQVDGIDLMNTGQEQFFKNFFDVAEYHYPIKIYNEKFMKDYFAQNNYEYLKDEHFDNYNKNIEGYLAFRLSNNIKRLNTFTNHFAKIFKTKVS